MKISLRSFTHAAVALLGLGSLSTSHAALLAYDPFNQAVGTLSGTHGTGVWPATGEDWSTGTSTVTAGTLTYGSLLTSGNKVSLDGVSFRDLGATLGGNGTDLWLSFLMKADANDIGLSLFSGGSELNFFGTPGGANGNYGAANPNLDLGVAYDTNTHLFVVHFDMTSDTTTVYLDPSFASLGLGLAPTGGTSASGSRGDFTFDNIRLGRFGGGSIVEFDEIRIGNTWQDVSPVPEPSAAILLLAGLGALVSLKRRRRA